MTLSSHDRSSLIHAQDEHKGRIGFRGKGQLQLMEKPPPIRRGLECCGSIRSEYATSGGRLRASGRERVLEAEEVEDIAQTWSARHAAIACARFLVHERRLEREEIEDVQRPATRAHVEVGIAPARAFAAARTRRSGVAISHN